MSQILIGSFNNRFVIGGKDWHLNFDKNNKEIFNIMKQFNPKEVWIMTGPGSFIGTRSVTAFSLGFTFNTNIIVRGFNMLIDLLPFMSRNHENIQKHKMLYFIQELHRFYYCIYEEDLNNRNFFLLSEEELKNLKYNHDLYIIGNDQLADLSIVLNFNNCFEIIDNLLKTNLNQEYIFKSLEYCGKFST